MNTFPCKITLDASLRTRRDQYRDVLLNNILPFWLRHAVDRECGGYHFSLGRRGERVDSDKGVWAQGRFIWLLSTHNEAEIAALMAWRVTGDASFRAHTRPFHEYAFTLFPDPDHNEWFGYFHRDGRRFSDLKGNHWKGPFHIPRMLLYG